MKISFHRSPQPVRGGEPGADLAGSGKAAGAEAARANDGGEESKTAAPRQELNNLKKFFGMSGPAKDVQQDPARHQPSGARVQDHQVSHDGNWRETKQLANEAAADIRLALAGEGAAIAAQSQQAREAKMSAHGVALDPARHDDQFMHPRQLGKPIDAETASLLKMASDDRQEALKSEGTTIARQGQQAREAKMSAHGVALDPARHDDQFMHPRQLGKPIDAETASLLKMAGDDRQEALKSEGTTIARQGQQARDAKMSAHGVALDPARHDDQFMHPRQLGKPIDAETAGLLKMASDDRQEALKSEGAQMAAAVKASKAGADAMPASLKADRATVAPEAPVVSAATQHKATPAA